MIRREKEFANKNETTMFSLHFLPSPFSAVIAARRLKSQWAGVIGLSLPQLIQKSKICNNYATDLKERQRNKSSIT